MQRYLVEMEWLLRVITQKDRGKYGFGLRMESVELRVEG